MKLPAPEASKPAVEERHGIVAILDALGAASYSQDEIRRFLRSREIVLGLLNQKAEDVREESRGQNLTTFTFNDTILVVLSAETSRISPGEISMFFKVMRKFLADSLAHSILFRGSIAIGGFYMDEHSSTIMGEAVTDAAAWYDEADWVGLAATPHGTMQIKSVEKHDKRDWRYLMLDYQVPMKGGRKVPLKVVNWPKAFLVPSITPCRQGEEPHAKLLELLSHHKQPYGTENKYFNTLEFFEHGIKESRKWDADQEAKKKLQRK